MDFKNASFKIGDIVQCRCPHGVGALPAGLPNDARARVVATYVAATYVCFEGNEFTVPNACVHNCPDAGETLMPPVIPTDPPHPDTSSPAT